MKKLMGILLATSMVFSLAACGSTADTAASSAAGTTATAEGSSNNQAPDVKVGAITVSYTHLDVYKRQHWYGALEMRSSATISPVWPSKAALAAAPPTW